MGELSKLPNIGKVVEEQLNKVGITTPEMLRKLGAEKAWLQIQKIDERACIHRLLALEGAILGIKKTLLSDERKAELKKFYNENRSKWSLLYELYWFEVIFDRFYKRYDFRSFRIRKRKWWRFCRFICWNWSCWKNFSKLRL